MMTKLIKFLREEEGTEVVEWVLVLSLVIVLTIAAVALAGQHTSQTWSSVSSRLFP